MNTPITYKKLLKHYEGIDNVFPAWFTAAIFRHLVKILTDPAKGKLHACKFLCDLSNQHGTREVHDLNWAKNMICDVVLPRDISTMSVSEKLNESIAANKEALLTLRSLLTTEAARVTGNIDQINDFVRNHEVVKKLEKIIAEA